MQAADLAAIFVALALVFLVYFSYFQAFKGSLNTVLYAAFAYNMGYLVKISFIPEMPKTNLIQ